MLPVSSLVLAGAIGLAEAVPIPQEHRTAIAAQQRAREEQLAALQEKARQRLAEDARWYGPEEIRDIEARYRLARQPITEFLVLGGASQLAELVEKYPRSTRSGCAVMTLAVGARGDERRRFLEVSRRPRRTPSTHGS